MTVARMFWVFGSLFPRRCGVFRAGCCGSGNVLLFRRCGVSWVSCRGRGGLWSIYLFWTPAFPIVCLVHNFFAVRTCHSLRPPRSSQEPRWTVQTETVRPRATQSHSNGCLHSGKEQHFPSPAEAGHGQEQYNQKSETTLRGSRRNLASCPGSGVFLWLRGLSVWSLVLVSAPLFPRVCCGVVFWVVRSAPSVLVSSSSGILPVLVFLGS